MIDATNRNTALASALVEELARCGARRAVISPGSRSTPIALALDREPGIELRVVIDERSAGFVALGAALGDRGPAIVACTSGSAAANLHPAVVEADQAGVPLIVLTSDRPAELRGIGAGQTIDQLKLYGSAVRWFCEVGNHEADDSGLIHLRATACRAFAAAVGDPTPGPVHLNLPWRDPLGPEARPSEVTAGRRLAVAGRDREAPLTAVEGGREPGRALLGRLGERIAAADRPLIVAGRQTDPGLAAPVTELAATVGGPILPEPISQLRFGPHDRQAVVSAYDAITRTAPGELTPDLVIRFGDMPTSKALRQWLGGLEERSEIVVDPPGRWNEPSRTAEAIVRADAASVARGLIEEVGSGSTGESGWVPRWREAERAAQAAIESVLGEEEAITEPAAHRALAGAYRDGDAALLASSMPVRDHEAFARPTDARVLALSNRGANGIDGTVSTAAGIAAATGRPTWVILGDLALVHDLGGLAALASVAAPLRLVVINNGGGGIFDFLPQAEQVPAPEFERLFTTPADLELERVAELFGLPYERVGSGEQIGALAERDRVLAEVRTDRRANRDLHRRLTDAVAAAIVEIGD